MGHIVEDSKQIQTMGPGGKLKVQYRVWIVTERGASGFIDIDAADWDAEVLREKLSEFADTLDLPFTLGE